MQIGIAFIAAHISINIASPPPPAIVTEPPSSAFITLVNQPLQGHLEVATKEFAAGNYRKAAALAKLVAPPEKIKIFFDYKSLKTDELEMARKVVPLVLTTWNDGLGRTALIETDINNAHVYVRFQKQALVGHQNCAGFAEVHRRTRISENGIEFELQATIVISTQFRNKVKMSEGQFAKTLSHEIGHVLGLCDVHDPSHLMGPIPATNAEFKPTERELQAVEELSIRSKNILESIPQHITQSRGPQIFRFK